MLSHCAWDGVSCRTTRFKLSEGLVTREIKVQGQEVTHAHLSPAKADHTRLALCKFVYGKMFDWLVGRVNRSFSGGKVS